MISQCRHYDSITAVDISDKHQQFIEDNFTDNQVEFRKENAYNLSFDNNSFDTVTLSNSIHHFKYPQKIAEEIFRVLKKDGKVIINEMYRDNLTKAQQSHKLLHHLAAEKDRILGRFHAYTYIKSKLIEFLNSLNFTQIKLIDYTYPVDDIFNKDTIEHINQVCEKLIKQAETNRDLKHLTSEYKKVRRYINSNGYAHASSIFYIGRK